METFELTSGHFACAILFDPSTVISVRGRWKFGSNVFGVCVCFNVVRSCSMCLMDIFLFFWVEWMAFMVLPATKEILNRMFCA